MNGFGAFLSFVVDVVILLTKFTHGAWVIVLLVPVMVYGLTRLNKQYEAEAHELERDARAAAEAPVFHRHTVLLLVATSTAPRRRAFNTPAACRPTS